MKRDAFIASPNPVPGIGRLELTPGWMGILIARLALEDDLPARLADKKALAAGYLGLIEERNALRAELAASQAHSAARKE